MNLYSYLLAGSVLLLIVAVLAHFCPRDPDGRCTQVRDYLVSLGKDGTLWRGVAMLLPGVLGLFGFSLELGDGFENKLAFVGMTISGILAIVWSPRSK